MVSSASRRPWLVSGLAVVFGVLVGWGAHELPFQGWRAIVPPIDRVPLLIRMDAKGDGRFGSPRSGNRSHRGVDLSAPIGTPVRAIRAGRVIATGVHRGLGRYVELEHRQNLRSLYAHLDGVSAEIDQRVRQGQVIGTVGKTGNARSPLIQPHLHVEILRDSTPIDPATLGLSMVELPKMPVRAALDGAAAGGE